MCGICGIAGQSYRKDTARDIISKMLSVIYHRGPDDEGVLIDEGIALGIRRLSIIDIEFGHQPMANEDGSVWVVSNGEIYNFLELKEGLEQKRHVFKTCSDTEVILHLYEDEGLDFVNKLSGMFSFCIWDKKKSTVILARDRFGIKPLYYTIKENILVFASELKSILSFPGIEKEINPDALNNYLLLEYIPSPLSIFKDIHKLQPAHILVYKNGNINIKKYWELKLDNNLKLRSELEARDSLMALLRKSIKSHFISDVPVGVYLSGGIDSSAIVALSGGLFPGRIKTFSIGFKEDSFDETRYSKEIAGLFNTEHQHRVFGYNDAISALPQIVKMLDEPLADSSIFPTYILSKFSKEYVTVALSGDGGDEIFGGYPTYQAHLFLKYYNRIPSFLRKKMIEKLIAKIPVDYRNFSLDFVAKKFISGANIHDPLRRHIEWMSTFDSKDRRDLCSDWLHNDQEEVFFNSLNLSNNMDELTFIQKLDIDTYLRDDLLVKTDRASMMNSQEVRVPFLDRELVEFVFSLPSDLKIKNFRTKYILKETMKKILPQSIINRKKKGFGMPVAFWIKNQLKGHILDMLSESSIEKQGLFNYRYINKILHEHISSKINHHKKIWTLFMFELWYQKYME